MEELSTPWQRSPAFPPRANLADGGDTNYPPSRSLCGEGDAVLELCHAVRRRHRFGEKGVSCFGVPSLGRGHWCTPFVQE